VEFRWEASGLERPGAAASRKQSAAQGGDDVPMPSAASRCHRAVLAALSRPGRVLHDPGEREFADRPPAAPLWLEGSRQQPVAMGCGYSQRPDLLLLPGLDGAMSCGLAGATVPTRTAEKAAMSQ